MASSCKRRICSNEKRGVRQEPDSWRNKLIDCVGIEKILKLILQTKILEDLRPFKDNKTASVSNWSFDENCLFCCLRREKVKEHVVALNNKIVQSGGKPLLGKDYSYISRLEEQVEEFLNAVLHRKEYTPRIPDPHIPVVACDNMQQLIGRLVVNCTSKNSQGSPQQNGSIDHSLLRSRSITSPTIAAMATPPDSLQNPVLSKLLIADQEAPLDLSVKKGKSEISVQDGVLDLSFKKNRNEDTPLRNPHCNFTTPVSTRDSLDPGIDKDEDLQSTSTLEEFMAKLCLHHQQQIVDALEFLQTEVNAVASPSKVQLSSPAAPEKSVTSNCSNATFEERFEELQPLSVAISITGVPESPDAKSKEVASVEQHLETAGTTIVPDKTEHSTDLSKLAIRNELLPSSNVVAVECGNTNIQPKCPALVIVKNRSSGSLETKTLSEECSNIQQLNTGTLEQDPCSSDTQLQSSSSELAVVELSPSSVDHGSSDPKCCLPVRGNYSLVPSCNSNFQRTARKSRGSHSRTRDRPGCHVINDPDVNYDIVYVRKPITECELQPQNHILPRKNARKSTRGHLYNGECRELKTVRTLAHKSAENGSGNCPVPEMTTSVTPKQALNKPDGVPGMDIPFTGDCMETAINQNPPDQPVDTEIPGDVVERASDDMIVEPSQTGQSRSKEQISSVLTDEHCDAFLQQNCNGIFDIIDRTSKKSNIANNDSDEKVEMLTKETAQTHTSSLIFDGLEVESETLQNKKSLNIDEGDPSDADGLEVGIDLVTRDTTNCDFQSKSVMQGEHLQMQVMTCTAKNGLIQSTHESEANIKLGESTKQKQGGVNESRIPNVGVEETTVKGQVVECKEKLVSDTPESTQSVVAKPPLPSGRHLRSRVLKGLIEHITDIPGQSELADLQIHDNICISKSKQPWNSVKLNNNEENVPSQDTESDSNAAENVVFEKAQQSSLVTHADGMEKMGNMVCTRRMLKHSVRVSEFDKEHDVMESVAPNNNKLQAPDCLSNDSPDSLVVTTERTFAKSLNISERMPLRNRSGPIKQSVSLVSCSPVRNNPNTSERMPLRSKTSIIADEPVEDSCLSPTSVPVERVERMPLRTRNSCFTEQKSGKGASHSLSIQSLDGVAHMHLRSRISSSIGPHVSEDSTELMKGKSNIPIPRSSSEDICVTSLRMESPGHMPVRNESIVMEQSPNSSLCTSSENTIESPGRMSLRSSTSAEKLDCLPSPSKSKRLSQKVQMSKTLAPSTQQGEQPWISNCAHVKTEKFKDQMKESSSKFLEALNKDGNKQLISDLYTRYEKGWVSVEKDGPPAPKPKNKADRLKEIWKSKRRIRRHRSLERQKLSPVQMLFRTHFELPSICRWYLQSTETQSLDIIKKLNTRPPSETQLGFQMSSSMPGSTDGVFPSPQAERLKKHLKKFAIASPVKCNAKNKKLIALAQRMLKMKEKQEQRPAARISSKPQRSGGLSQTKATESHSKAVASAKNPASARILRKYSNMRGKKQVQQISLKSKRRSVGAANKKCETPKNLSKGKLSTCRGQKSGIVSKVKTLTKKAREKYTARRKISKSSPGRVLRDLNERDGISPRALKSPPVTAAKTINRKEMLMKTERSPQINANSKKSPLRKASESSVSQSQNVKPLSEDQVLTRSQRKIEATFTRTGSLKAPMKRGSKALASSAKRTRLSK